VEVDSLIPTSTAEYDKLTEAVDPSEGMWVRVCGLSKACLLYFLFGFAKTCSYSTY
jgi:hypothetical protein